MYHTEMFQQARLIKPVTPRNTIQSQPTHSQNSESRWSSRLEPAPSIGDARKEFNVNQPWNSSDPLNFIQLLLRLTGV